MERPVLNTEKFLGSIEPFKALAPADLKKISSCAREKVFAKEEVVYNEGDVADSVWVVYEGRIQVFKYTTAGRPFALETLGPGELFGTLCRMGGNGRLYPCTAVAAKKTSVIRILDRVFVDCYMRSPGLLRGICSLCSDRLKDVQDLRCMGQESVHIKLAGILTRLYQVHGKVIPFTKKEISELIGTALETTFRAVGDFQKKGLIESSRGQILIKNPEEIRTLSNKD